MTLRMYFVCVCLDDGWNLKLKRGRIGTAAESLIRAVVITDKSVLKPGDRLSE